jgi:hypothetical protein
MRGIWIGGILTRNPRPQERFKLNCGPILKCRRLIPRGFGLRREAERHAAFVRAKAVSPLRSATAVHDASAWFGRQLVYSRLQNFLNRSSSDISQAIL